MSDLGISLLGSALWTAFVASIGIAWYLLGGRASEKTWIRNHGLMLLVYFRNVDWRCCRIQELLTQTPGLWRDEPEQLLDMLVKLEADLEAFDRLAKVWARRLDHFPLWYPYARTIRAFLEAQDELHVALCRHVTPLRHLLERACGPMPIAAREETECRAYIDYFLGGRDRLWGSSTEGSALEPLRNVRLADRLQDVFSYLERLMRKNGAADTATLRIWRPSESPTQVWFSGRDHVLSPRPSTFAENPGAASPAWLHPVAQGTLAD